MVLEIVCQVCGTILYSGFDLRSAKDVLKQYNGRCKNCGTLLSYQDFDIQISSRT